MSEFDTEAPYRSVEQFEIRCQGIDSPCWLFRYRFFVRKLLELRHGLLWEISFILCSDAFIQQLNARYRGQDKSTDVLSFPQDGPQTGIMGDVVISLEKLKENASFYAVSEQEELKRLTVHGVLHLEGMDHQKSSEEVEMLGIQEQILAEMADVTLWD